MLLQVPIHFSDDRDKLIDTIKIIILRRVLKKREKMWIAIKTFIFLNINQNVKLQINWPQILNSKQLLI